MRMSMSYKTMDGKRVVLNPLRIESVFEGDHKFEVSGHTSVCVLMSCGVVYHLDHSFDLFLEDVRGKM